MIAVGEWLGDTYRIEAELGRGGMSVVYRAAHVRLASQVAIKVLHANLDDETVQARFRREAELLTALKHPNIVAAQDFNQVDGQLYLVMELLEGQDLAQRLASRDPVPLGLALTLTRQIAAALTAAHERGIVHRDLKPQNVFLCRGTDGDEPIVKLLDFGISKLLGAANALTTSALSMGTPSYMSPEQARGASASVDARADQFSLAVLVYEMLAGRLPFLRGPSPLLTMARILTDEPPPIADLPPSVMPVLWKALAKDADERWPSVAAFVAALDRAAAGVAVAGRIPPRANSPAAAFDATTPASAPTTERVHGRRRTWMVALALAIALAGAVAATLLLRAFAKPPPAVAVPVAAPPKQTPP